MNNFRKYINSHSLKTLIRIHVFNFPIFQFSNLSIFQSFNLLILSILTLNSTLLISQNSLDQLTYSYKANTNQLKYITDVVDPAASAVDLDNQNLNNYVYDASGQLTKDEAEGILNISWTVIGKVKQVSIDDDNNGVADRTLKFNYDAMGNRVKKMETTISSGNTITTYYIYNAIGLLISTYKDEGSGAERNEIVLAVGIDNAASDSITNGVYTRNVGLKNYELKDHLGSVRVVVNDVKEPPPLGTTAFTSNIKHSADYYSYGALMPGRDFSSSTYHYGFQGKEKDDELKGNGNSYDFGARLLDPRVGRWLSIDPSAAKFPSESPYSAMGNSPIVKNDPDGKVAKSVVFDQANHTITISVDIYIFGEGVDAYRNGREPGATADDPTMKSFGTSYLTEQITTSIQNAYQIKHSGSKRTPVGNGNVSQVRGSTPYTYVVTADMQAKLKSEYGIEVAEGVYNINMDITVQEETPASKALQDANHIEIPWSDKSARQRASGVEPGRSYVDGIAVGGIANTGLWYLITEKRQITWAHELLHLLGAGDKYSLKTNQACPGWENDLASNMQSSQSIPGRHNVWEDDYGNGPELVLTPERRIVDNPASNRIMGRIIDANFGTPDPEECE